MVNQIVTITPEEKKALEMWISESDNSNQNAPVGILSLILYKLHLLEAKIDRIEYQTKTHWADSSI